MPRFDAPMQADEQQARGTQLGSDLSVLDTDLQSENAASLFPARRVTRPTCKL